MRVLLPLLAACLQFTCSVAISACTTTVPFATTTRSHKGTSTRLIYSGTTTKTPINTHTVTTHTARTTVVYTATSTYTFTSTKFTSSTTKTYTATTGDTKYVFHTCPPQVSKRAVEAARVDAVKWGIERAELQRRASTTCSGTKTHVVTATVWSYDGTTTLYSKVTHWAKSVTITSSKTITQTITSSGSTLITTRTTLPTVTRTVRLTVTNVAYKTTTLRGVYSTSAFTTVTASAPTATATADLFSLEIYNTSVSNPAVGLNDVDGYTLGFQLANASGYAIVQDTVVSRFYISAEGYLRELKTGKFAYYDMADGGGPFGFIYADPSGAVDDYALPLVCAGKCGGRLTCKNNVFLAFGNGSVGDDIGTAYGSGDDNVAASNDPERPLYPLLLRLVGPTAKVGK